MKKSDFYYDLPEALIAQTPVEPRDASRLLVYDQVGQTTQHAVFRDVLEYLSPGDVLVLNETRVIPARLNGTKQNGTAKAEVLLLRALTDTDWEALIRPGKRLPVGARIEFGPDFSCEVKEKKQEGVAGVSFSYSGDFHALVEKYGKAPLPPYIHDESPDKERYQTVYAKTNGSAAAPTAGLHFTPELLAAAKDKGVQVVPILLHVGLGTFRPVKEDEITDHTMHSEYAHTGKRGRCKWHCACWQWGNGYFYLPRLHIQMCGGHHHQFSLAREHAIDAGCCIYWQRASHGAVSTGSGRAISVL